MILIRRGGIIRGGVVELGRTWLAYVSSSSEEEVPFPSRCRIWLLFWMNYGWSLR